MLSWWASGLYKLRIITNEGQGKSGGQQLFKLSHGPRCDQEGESMRR